LQGLAPVQAARAQADDAQEYELHRHEAQHDRGDRTRLAEHARQVDAHAHGHEEQAQQQALEGLDLGLEFVPEFRVGQQHAGQERAQAG